MHNLLNVDNTVGGSHDEKFLKKFEEVHTLQAAQGDSPSDPSAPQNHGDPQSVRPQRQDVEQAAPGDVWHDTG